MSKESRDAAILFDGNFIREKINSIVGRIFHSGRQLGSENAPNAMDWGELQKGTGEVYKLLVTESAALRAENKRLQNLLESSAEAIELCLNDVSRSYPLASMVNRELLQIRAALSTNQPDSGGE